MIVTPQERAAPAAQGGAAIPASRMPPARAAREPLGGWVGPLVLASLGLSLWLWVALRREVAVFVYGKLGYWLMLALATVWAWQMWRFFRERGVRWPELARRQWVPLAMAGAMTAVAVTSVRPEFRVLSDETNLLGVSQSMVYHKTTYNSTQQKRYFETMNPISFELEKRPLVFPFFVHLVHLVRGYSPENPFVLNAGVLFALLAVLGVAANRLGGAACAAGAVALVGSYPLVVACARSGGFDLLATFFAVVSLGLAYLHMLRPSGRSMALLTATVLVFAQVRYESLVYVAVIGAGLLVFRHVRWSYLREQLWLYALAPLLLAPLVAQRVLMPRPYENEADVAAFSLRSLGGFLGRFFSAQVNFEFFQPHVPVLYWLALPALALLAGWWLRRRAAVGAQPHLQWVLIVVGALAVSHVVLFSYYFGDFTHPASARFFLNLSIVVALAPVALHLLRPAWLTAPRFVALAALIAVVHHPVTLQDRFTASQTLWRESRIEWQFLAQRADPNVLVIAARPGQFTVMNYGAVDFGHARNNTAALLNELRRNLYSDIIVFQRISYESGAPVGPDTLGPGFALQPLKELQSSAGSYIRISRVVP